MKKRGELRKGGSVSFRPTVTMRQTLEKLAMNKTRGLGDQVEHLVKIGLVVTEAFGTDDIDTLMTKLKVPASTLSIIAEQSASFGSKIVNTDKRTK